jgi:glycosyltransferase involved in cell wall biosynthesis
VRVAVIAPGYWPIVGGIEMLVQETSEALVAGGTDVEVWTQTTAQSVITAHTHNGVLVRRFPATHSRRYPISVSLARYARRNAPNFDVVHVHNYHAMPASTALLIDRSTPLVFSAHYHGGGHTTFARVLHLPYRPVGERILRRADRIIAASRAERDLLVRSIPGLGAKIDVVHNGVDEQLIRAAEPYPNEPPTILVLGRLEAYKHVGRALAAFAALDPPAQMVIVGDGTERQRLQAQAIPFGGRVRILGAVERDAVRRWLRTARVVVNMSNNEAFGVVALEGVCAGATAVVSDIPAHCEVRELVEPGHVVTVDPSAPMALEQALRSALTTPNAHARPTRSWCDVADDYLAHYRAVVGR